MPKVLLILPCNKMAKAGDYKKGNNWRLVLKHIKPWREKGLVDLAAVDCIDMLGIVPEWENYKTIGKDEYPSWSKFKDPVKFRQLVEAISAKLLDLAPHYSHIIVYVNVRAYYEALKIALAKIRMAKVFLLKLNHFSPLAFNSNVHKVVDILNKIFPLE
ncbi:MAG: hypothetical protein QXR87_03960 [Candidatus Hadarchaeales archaeon]